jgi:hypothetical protein
MEHKPYAVIDNSAFPIVKVSFTGEKSTDLNFHHYLKSLKECYSHQQPLAIIFEATKAVIPKFSHQKQQANWIKENWTLIQNQCQGTAYIIPSLIIQMVLKSILLLQKQPVPYKVFSNEKDGEDWLKSLL